MKIRCTVGFQKTQRFKNYIIDGEGDFGATFGVKTDQFTWGSGAS